MSSDPSAPRFDAAYLGAPGSYSEQAAEALVGDAARTLALPSLDEVVAAVVDGRARAAVVPVENSVAGTVPHSYELLLDSSLIVSGETLVAIDHVLVAPETTRRVDVRRVLSHPVALAQCRGFFRRHPEIEAVPESDTANAVARVVTAADGCSAAIASRRAAALRGAMVLEENIQDDPDNWTRFLLLAAAPGPIPSSDVLRKALVVFGLPHTPGALARALAPLGECNLNLTRIESRAIHGRPFEYQFIAELAVPAGHVTLEAALDSMRRATAWLRLVGVFELTPAPATSTVRGTPPSLQEP
jgi:prephenate dehydratase